MIAQQLNGSAISFQSENIKLQMRETIHPLNLHIVLIVSFCIRTIGQVL